MMKFLSLIEGNSMAINKLATILSITIITLLGLLCISLFNSYKLKKEIERLKAQNNK